MNDQTDDPNPTRASLLSRLKDWDDEESWRDFLNLYQPLITATARRAGLSESEAEDVVQETVVAVTKKMRDFKYDPARGSFKGRLRVLTQRRIADHQRRAGRRVATVELARRDDTNTEPLDALPDPDSLEPDLKWDEDWEANLLRAARERVKAKVSALTFQIYDYHVVQGQSAAQTCKALGVSNGKVYMAKLRVGRLLRRELEALKEEMV